MIRIFTHNDLDGLGCGLLGKMAWNNDVEVVYCSNGNVDKKVKKFFDDKKHAGTSFYLTDISVNDYLAAKIEEHHKKGNTVQMVDHHKTALKFNQYEWAMVKEKYRDGRKTSATSLFYEYLVEQGHLERTAFLDQFVELIRLYDTWEWESENNMEARKLNDLFYIVGLGHFEEEMLERSKNEQFTFSKQEEFILELEAKKMERYIHSKDYQMIQKWFENYKIGIVYAEQYNSELGNELSKKHPYLDFVVLLNPGASKISLRTIHDHVNVSQVAKHFGGGGHPKASGCPLTEKALETFMIDPFGKKPNKRDAENNFYNRKESKYGSLYKDHYDQYVSIIPIKNGKWEIYKNKITMATNFITFQDAENYLKKSLSAALVHDEEYITYMSEKYGFTKTKLRSQFERTIKEAKKEVLV